MITTRLNPHNYPLQQGESWWIVHPNQSNCEFKVPAGGITVCTESFLAFNQNTAYTVLGDDPHNGWITVQSSIDIVEMPYYVFARYFDAEAFVRGTVESTAQLEKAKPFDYKPTLPRNPKQVEMFEDNHCRPLGGSAKTQEDILQRAEEQENKDDWEGVR